MLFLTWILQTIINEEEFTPYLQVAAIRILFQEPNERDALYPIVVDVTACYEQYLGAQGVLQLNKILLNEKCFQFFFFHCLAFLLS